MLEKTANKYSMMDLDKSDMLSNIDDMDTLVDKPFKFKNRDSRVSSITVYTETPMKIWVKRGWTKFYFFQPNSRWVG